MAAIKINVNENPEQAKQFGVLYIPALVVMEKEMIIRQTRGARRKKTILAIL